MEFAVNYSPALAELVRAGRVRVDLYKSAALQKETKRHSAKVSL
jgi:hypothetical protein